MKTPKGKPDRARKEDKKHTCSAAFINQLDLVCEPLSLDDYKNIICAVASLPLMELQLLAAAEDIPAAVAIISKALLEDMKKGSIQNIEKLIDRAFGKDSSKQDASDAAKNLVTQINITSIPNAVTHFADKENECGL